MPDINEIADVLSEDILSKLPEEVIDQLASISGTDEEISVKIKEILQNNNIDVESLISEKIKGENHE